MKDPSILFVKPKAISNADKKSLTAAGIVVVEVEDPQAVKFVRAATEISHSALLVAAMDAMLKSGYYAEFGKAVGIAIKAAHADRQQNA